MKVQQQLWQGIHYIEYRLFSRHRLGHGIHSPFLFDLVTRVFPDEKRESGLKKIEELRNKTRERKGLISTGDPGAGSALGRKQGREAGIRAVRMGVPPRYGRLLFRLARSLQPPVVLELGTGAGMSTLYLALGAGGVPFYSIEARPELAGIARANLQEAGCREVEVIGGRFEEVLPGLLEAMDPPGLVFFDGDHREEAVWQWFETCLEYCAEDALLVFDDIYWSRGMTRAWKRICAHPAARMSVDLFRFGLVFLNRGLTPGKYRVRF